MRRTLIAALILFPGTLVAQDRAAPILDFIRAIPTPLEEATTVLGYGDPAAMREVSANLAPGDAAFLAMARTMPQAVATNAAMLMDSFADGHGIEITAIDRIATLSGGDVLSAMSVDIGAQDAAAIGPALAENFGYVADARLGPEIWARGEDGTIDLLVRDDFFGLNMGHASRILPTDTGLVHANSWPMMERALVGENAISDHPEIAALIRALDAENAPGGILVGVRIFFGLSDDDPAPALMIADLVEGEKDTAFLVLIAEDMTVANTMADNARSSWDTEQSQLVPRTFAEILFGPIIAGTAEIDGTAMVMLTATGLPEPGMPPWRNIRTERLEQLLINDELGSIFD